MKRRHRACAVTGVEAKTRAVAARGGMPPAVRRADGPRFREDCGGDAIRVP